ncbi:unnamed protein product [Brassica rapa]|uniref:Uncharacterized protein n=1 Tax=Brassica campestris TaxID=3711 RepID=A0A8D9D5T4_BRACM|nr:unnamed protein product [Brassica rapa]
MTSSFGCFTDSLPHLSTSFLQLQVRVIGEKMAARSIALCSHNNVVESRCRKNCWTDCARAQRTILAGGAAAKSEALKEEVLIMCLFKDNPMAELILIEHGKSLTCLFDGLALAFHRKLESKGSEPKVVLATSINPKTVGGEKTITFLFL